MIKLLIPWALDEAGDVVNVSAAVKGDRYICPQCSTPLVFRCGKIKQRHFAHPPTSNCTGESIEHWAAKHALVNVIKGEPHSIFLNPACVDCEDPLPLTEDATHARLEVTLPTGRRVDVMVYGPGDKPLFAVEVLHTHRVDEDKARDMTVAWIEVEAKDVLADPNHLQPVNMSTNFRPSDCLTCEEPRQWDQQGIRPWKLIALCAEQSCGACFTAQHHPPRAYRPSEWVKARAEVLRWAVAHVIVTKHSVRWLALAVRRVDGEVERLPGPLIVETIDGANLDLARSRFAYITPATAPKPRRSRRTHRHLH